MLNHVPNIELAAALAIMTPRPAGGTLHIRVSVDYPGKPNVLRDVTLDIAQGEIVGLIGESGSGKSTLALSILRLLHGKGARVQGEIAFCGRHLERLAEREMRRIRGKDLALIFQSAVASLNPALRIGTQFAESWKARRRGRSVDWKRSAFAMLERVGLPPNEEFLRRYPRQLSVGQAQRVLIAMAVLHRPRLLIADEPTSALDAITRAEVIDLLKGLNRETGMAILFISHDLLLVSSLCSRVAILKQGEIVESGSMTRILLNPEQAYTRALLRGLPLKSALAAERVGEA